jgi:hypothetical protein
MPEPRLHSSRQTPYRMRQRTLYFRVGRGGNNASLTNSQAVSIYSQIMPIILSYLCDHWVRLRPLHVRKAWFF